MWIAPATAVVLWMGARLQPRPVGSSARESAVQVADLTPTQFENRDTLNAGTARRHPMNDVEIAVLNTALATRQQQVNRENALQTPAAEQASSPTDRVALKHPTTTSTSQPTTDLPRLRVRQIVSDAPQWTTADNIDAGRELFPLSSERFATLAEAEENVTRMALKLIEERWRSEAARTLTWGSLDIRQEELIAAGEFPRQFARSAESWSMADMKTFVDVINRRAVHDLVGEVMDWDFKNGTVGKMYRAHLRLDLTPAYHNEVRTVARSQVVAHRMQILGSMLGLVTLMLGTSAGYFKLDAATGGTYRRRLKLAAVAVIAAGSLITAHILPS